MKDGKRSRMPLSALAVAASLAAAVVLYDAPSVLAQDAEGRGGGGIPFGTTAKPKPKARPKKRIRARAATDVERVPTSSVIIRSYPDGAEVFVDGKLIGTTADDGEVELEDMRLGGHLVVLKKPGFRDWSQTITLRTSAPVEVNPVLQSLNTPILRDLTKIAVMEVGSPVSGQLAREDMEATDGTGFYDEFRFRIAGPDAFLLKVSAAGFAPSLKILDDDNRMFDVRPLAPGIFQTVTLPRPGTYYLRVSAEIDESSFVGGDYTILMRSEAALQAPQSIAIGETQEGALEETDRMRGPDDFYDVWTFEGRQGARVAVRAESTAFTPSLTLMHNNVTVASSGTAPKGKKKGTSGGPGVELDLQAGTYTIHIRSGGGARTGAYRLTVASQ